MDSLVILLILISILVVFGIAEYSVHKRNLNSIPIRIHVNGTRGKSSVTRLIAGALREYGLKTFAKTTGTLPRMIMDDGREYPIYRPIGANVIEQLRIVSLAAGNKADALVIECMALRPFLQSLTELKFIRSTHGVITNGRADHLDVMGPSERDVVLALLGSTPHNGRIFTAEQDYDAEFEIACRDRNSQLYAVKQEEIERISDGDMAGFTYVEHKENVALVLKVCEALNISRDTALRGMWKAQPDPGVMKEYEITFFGRKIIFVNGFAANDPESTEKIWRMALEKHHPFERSIMIVNSRHDRPERSKQLAEALPSWPQADRYILIGTGVYIMYRTAVASGIDSTKLIYAEGMKEDKIFEEILGLTSESSMVMGIGNIASPGLELVHYFQNRAALQ